MDIGRRLWRATIWHPDAIPASEGELARDVKRWVLPPFDMLIIFGSYLGLHGGMPNLAIVYNDAVSHAASIAVLVFAVACLIGVSFPHLWALELSAKVGLVTVLITYTILLFALAAWEYPARGFISGAMAAVTVLPVWRIVWLGREERHRRARRELGLTEGA